MTGSTTIKLSFRTLNNNTDPTFNQLLGINNHGEIAGYFGSGAQGHPNQGYTLTPHYGQGKYTNENFPNSVQTQVTGINDHGLTVGFWADSNNANMVNNNFGFVDDNGVFTNVVDPNGQGVDGGMTVEQLLGVNDRGVAVGFWTDSLGNANGFIYNVKDKSFTEDDISGYTSTTAAAINNKGDIAGFVSNGNGDTSFIQHSDGQIQFLAGPAGSTSTQALGINDFDEVVGVYTDNQGDMHGFLFNEMKNMYITLDDPNAATGSGSMTVANGVNDKGQIVGFYLDPNGNTDGMLVNVGGHHAYMS